MMEDIHANAFSELIREEYAEDEVGHGAHWQIFFDDTAVLLHQLPTAAEKGCVLTTRADDPNACPLPFPGSEPTALVLGWPSAERGMIQVLQTDAQGNLEAFVSAYPWVSDGITHMVQLQGVRIWPDRLEAHLEVAVGDLTMLTFFDALFAKNRVFYRQNGFYPFVLTAFAYTVVIGEKPNLLSGIEGSITDKPTVRLIQDGVCADDYQFVGRVKTCTTIRFLDRPVLLALVNFGCFAAPFEEDFDLTLIITDFALGFGREPEAGDWISGRLWLTGHLSSPSSELR